MKKPDLKKCMLMGVTTGLLATSGLMADSPMNQTNPYGNQQPMGSMRDQSMGTMRGQSDTMNSSFTEANDSSNMPQQSGMMRGARSNHPFDNAIDQNRMKGQDQSQMMMNGGPNAMRRQQTRGAGCGGQSNMVSWDSDNSRNMNAYSDNQNRSEGMRNRDMRNMNSSDQNRWNNMRESDRNSQRDFGNQNDRSNQNSNTRTREGQLAWGWGEDTENKESKKYDTSSSSYGDTKANANKTDMKSYDKKGWERPQNGMTPRTMNKTDSNSDGQLALEDIYPAPRANPPGRIVNRPNQTINGGKSCNGKAGCSG